MRRFFFRLLTLFRRESAERELAREIAAHVGLLEEEFERRGMTAAQARRAARLALGGIERTKELQRDARSFVWVDDARRDFLHAARILRRNPVFAVTAVLSLAIGIGANTAVFTVADALLFRNPVGVANPDRLVDIGVSRDDGGLNPASYRTFLDISRGATTLAGVYAHPMFPEAVALEIAGSQLPAERVFAQFVTTNSFTVLGATPAVGRLLGAIDSDAPGASPVVVLSHDFWIRRFNKDPTVIGRAIRLNGSAFTIVGVAPDRFQGTGVLSGDVWLPLNVMSRGAAREALLTGRGGWLIIGGRLKPQVSLAQATAEIDALGRALDADNPNPTQRRGLRLLPSSRVPGNTGVVAGFFTVLMIVVSLVLLVACANLAGILLARSAARRREMAVRLAIGAERARLIRQLLTETVMLFVLGGLAGVVLARVLTSLLIPLLPQLPFPIAVTLALDWRVIAFTTALSFIAALLSGLAPALQASKADVVTSLKADPEGPPSRSKLRSAFVITQVAFSLVLVIVAGLFVRALHHAGSTNPGFDPHGVELASLDITMSGYTEATGPIFWRDLLERVRQLPEVQAATIARVLPGGFEGIGMGGVRLPDARGGDEVAAPSWNIVEPGYFETLRIPLVAGRDFSATDVAGAQAVVIIGEGLARRFWPGQNAVGKYLIWPRSGSDRSNATRTLLVVGVARDVKSSSLIDGLARSFVYLPLQQHYTSQMTATMTIAARTARGRRIVDDIRALIASMDPNLAIVTTQSLEESTALGLVPQRVVASIAGSLGTIGLLLAAIGIYGVTAYLVARRSREIGIRIALGAKHRDVIRMVLGNGVRLTVTGLAIGLILAAGLSQLLSGYLFGLPPLDTATFIAAALVFAIVGALACYLPARSATNIDPSTALRAE